MKHSDMRIYTIGFSGKKQDAFMEILSAAGVRALIDVRLWCAARFVPWANGTNLAATLGDKYRYMPEFAPTKELLTAYKEGKIDWPEYERIFNDLLAERQVEKLFATAADLDDVCFLCAEKSADQCHRHLVVEYLISYFPDIKAEHL